MKKMKKAFALLTSLALIFSFSLLALGQEEETSSGYSSLAEGGTALGDRLTELIGGMGGEVDFDFSSLFGGLGALGDIDLGGYLSEINVGSLSGDLQDFAGNFFNTEGMEDVDIGNIFNDIGMGDFSQILGGAGGLGSIIGIGSGSDADGSGDPNNPDDGSGGLDSILDLGNGGGFSDVISGFAGSIADMTGNFDITEALGGLMGGLGSGSSSGTGSNNTGTDTNTTSPTPTPSPSPGNNTITVNPPANNIAVPTERDEPTTQEFTTQRIIIQQQVTSPEENIPEEPEERNTSKIVAGIILVLGSFGTIAYIIIRKVI